MTEKWRCRLSGDSKGKWEEIQAESPGSAAVFYVKFLSKSQGHDQRRVDVMDKNGHLTQCIVDCRIVYEGYVD